MWLSAALRQASWQESVCRLLFCDGTLRPHKRLLATSGVRFLRGFAVVVIFLAAVAQAQISAPTNVSVSTSAGDRFKWVNGQANISWTPVAGAVDYRVVVDPLYNGYTESFTVSAEVPAAAVNSSFQDFVIEPGKASNSVRVVNGVLRLGLDEWSWTNVTASLDSAPVAVRRIPESIPTAGSNAFIQVDVDCSGAPDISTIPASTPAAVMCGIVVQNAANRLPLLFWGLKRTNA